MHGADEADEDSGGDGEDDGDEEAYGHDVEVAITFGHDAAGQELRHEEEGDAEDAHGDEHVEGMETFGAGEAEVVGDLRGGSIEECGYAAPIFVNHEGCAGEHAEENDDGLDDVGVGDGAHAAEDQICDNNKGHGADTFEIADFSIREAFHEFADTDKLYG